MIYFRPHHFLCAYNFQGKGYNPAFVDNFNQIMHQLRSHQGDHTLIEVVLETDDICSPCPHRRARRCQKQTKIERIDHRHAQALNVQPGDQLTWGQAKQRMQHSIDIPTFHHICAGCEWKKLGICEQGVVKLQDKE